jgi:hypothetical protein
MRPCHLNPVERKATGDLISNAIAKTGGVAPERISVQGRHCCPLHGGYIRAARPWGPDWCGDFHPIAGPAQSVDCSVRELRHSNIQR